MEKRWWFENKKWFFYIFVLLQTVIILLTAGYVAFFFTNTNTGNSFSLKERYSQFLDVRDENKERKYHRKAFKAFDIVVMAKGRLDMGNRQNGKGMESHVMKRINESRIKTYDNVKKNKMLEHYSNVNDGSSRRRNNNKRNNNKNGIKIKNKNKKKNNKNKLYQTSISKQNPQRNPILMFIAIMSAPERVHRRNALRRSWLRQCKQHNTSCHIFTDAQDMYGKRLPEEIYVSLQQEQFLHKDLIFTETPGGINFARRYLWIINWANERYKFDFLLRVDDDYFVCMDRLFLELPFRKTIKKLYWGHVHCYPPGKCGWFDHQLAS